MAKNALYLLIFALAAMACLTTLAVFKLVPGELVYVAIGTFGGWFIPSPVKTKVTKAIKEAAPGSLLVLMSVSLLLMCFGCARKPAVPVVPIPPPDEPQYQECLRLAKALFNAESDLQCPPDKVQWLQCEHRDAINARYKSNQEACRA